MPRYSLVTIKGSANWYVQWFEGRHSRRRSTGTSRRGEAEAFLSAFKLEAERSPHGPLGVSDLLDWYLQHRWHPKPAPATEVYGANHLRRFFGSMQAIDAGVAAQQLYADHRRIQGVKDETIRRELGVLSAALNRAEKHEKITRAPATLTLEKSEPRERWLSRKEAARILRHLRTDKRARHLLLFTRLALYTGARTGAILDLTWDRVDLVRGMINYPVPGRSSATKGRATVPIEPPMVRALKAAQRRSVSRYVVAWHGKKCARIIRGFKRHVQPLGMLDVTPHTLRHTFATWAALKGVPLFLVGRALGQSVVATTERYAKHQPDALREVMRAVRRK